MKNKLGADKNKKPLKLLKKAMGIALAGVLTTTPLILGGCATEGKDGKDAAQWYYGIETPTLENRPGNVGDFYIDTDDYILYQKDENGQWTILIKDFGKPGEAGKDGTSVYIGYDGYVWNGKERTDLAFTTIGEGVAENTLELKDNKYFKTSTIAAGTKIALMTNYFKNIKYTLYSASTIKEITTYVSKAGKLDIGVVNLSTGQYTLKETKDVNTGKNVLNVNISVAEGETLVLGGENTTVELYKTSGVEAGDEYGLFSININDFELSQTENINDKLIINVKAVASTTKVLCSTPELETEYAKRTTGYTSVVNSAGPFIYTDLDKFAGQTIKKIKLYVNTVTYDSNNLATMDIGVFTVPGPLAAGDTVPNYDETYQIRLPKEFLENKTTINSWVEIDLTQYAYNSNGEKATDGIFVNNNQTLSFCANKAETIMWGYNNGGKFTVNEGEQFWQTTSDRKLKDNVETTSLNLLFYVDTDVECNIQENIKAYKELDNQAYFESQLSGKYLSILGDSISTYRGVSNNEEEGLNNNAVYYNNQISQQDTYWQQIISNYNMNLCVNNAWSGAFVSQHKPNVNGNLDPDGTISSGMARANKLAKSDGTVPDYIIVYIGVNDLNAGVSTSIFAEAYDKMLETLHITYPNAKIFCVNMANRTSANSPLSYNSEISKAVNAYENVYLIDLYNSEYGGEVYKENSLDNLHPNAKGMDFMTDIIVDGIKEVILEEINN